MHVFLTGAVRVGKSAVVNKIAAALPPELISGFRTLSVEPAIPNALAEVYIVPAWEAAPSLNRDRLIGVRWGEGQFTAFPQTFESGGLAILNTARNANLLIMDELGFMESQAPRFRQAVLAKLDEAIPILGVIKPQEAPWLDAVRAHPGVKTLAVTPENRDRLPLLVRELLIF